MVVGGAEKVLIDLVNNLDSNKYEITVIAIFKKSVYSDYEFQFEQSFASHIRYHWLVDNSNALKYKVFNFLYNKLPKSWLYCTLVKEKYDIEVSFYEGLPTVFVSHSIRKNIKVTWLHTHQERLYRNLSAVQLQDMCDTYKKFNAIVGVSKAVSDSFTSVFNDLCPTTLYNPIDETLVKGKGDSAVDTSIAHLLAANYLVTVGRLIPIKGYDRLIRVFGKLKSEGYDFKLLMIGAGYKKDEYKMLIKENNLETNIFLLGHIDNPYPYIRKADALVMSSLQEGLSTVVCESLILKTPVLTTRCSGMDELINDDENGWITENTEKGLYEMLKYAVQNTSFLKKIKNNLIHTESQATLSLRVEEMEKFLDSFIIKT